MIVWEKKSTPFSKAQFFKMPDNKVPQIEFLFDSISPYSFLALEILDRYRKLYHFDLKLIPVSLHFIMKASRNKPPFMVESKGIYARKDLERLFNYYHLGHVAIPSQFPLNTLLTQKVLTVVEQDYNEKLFELSRTVWVYYWQNDKRIDLPDVIKEALIANGFTAEVIDVIFERAKSTQISDLLTERTEKAVSNGVFGVPSFLVKRDEHSDKELFFGSDRVDVMMKWIGFDPVLPPSVKSNL